MGAEGEEGEEGDCRRETVREQHHEEEKVT